MRKPGQWWDSTWSPVSGCTPVGEGCARCHTLRRLKRRLPALRGAGNADAPPSTVLCHPERLDKPLHWRRPRVVLTPMLGDLFHEQVPDQFVVQVFDAMPGQHTFVVLTKRPARAVNWINSLAAIRRESGNYWRNVLLLASVWDQASADAACAALSRLRGVRWGLHCEPLLGPINLERPSACHGHHDCPTACNCGEPHFCGGRICGLQVNGPRWIVTGGENGPGARPMSIDWCLDLMDQCKAAGVPYWHKSHGDVVKREMQRLGLSDVDPDNRLLDGEAWNEVPW